METEITQINFTGQLSSIQTQANTNLNVQITWDWTWPIIVVFSLLSTVGNLIIFVIICVSPKFRRPVNFLIANLALTSIAYVGSVIFRYLEDEYGIWRYDTPTCRILGILHRLPITIEAFTVTIISIDRLHVVKEPLTPETKRGALLKISLVWCMAILIEIPRGFYHEFDSSVLTSNYKCRKVFLLQNAVFHLLYVSTHLIVVYALPTIILFTELVKLRAHMAFLVLCHNPNDAYLSARLRLLKSASYLIWFFIIIHLPLGLSHALHECTKELLPAWLYRGLKLTRYQLYVFSTLHSYFYSILIFFSSYELRDYIRSCMSRSRDSTR